MIGHDLAAALPELRAHAESQMLDFGMAFEDLGSVYDKDEQEHVPNRRVLFESRAKLQVRTMQPRAEEVGGRTATTIRMELHLPAAPPTGVDLAVYALQEGDLWCFTEVHPLSMTELGSVWKVLSPVGKTFATARRYEVERVVS